MKNGLSRETRAVLEAIVKDIDGLLAGPQADEWVSSETDLRVLVPVTSRQRVLLVREMERVEAYRSRAGGRAFDPPPRLGTLLRGARLEFRAALSEMEG